MTKQECGADVEITYAKSGRIPWYYNLAI